MRKSKKVEGIVLWHVDGLGTYKAFDVFVKKKYVKKYKKKFDYLYDVNCVFKEAFKEVFKNYVFIGSEDDLHSYPLNYKFPKTFKIILFTFCPNYPCFLNKKEYNKLKEEIKEEMKKSLNLE
jgi:hypothetical protein